MTVSDKGSVNYNGWKGLRNTVDQESFGAGDLSVALNVDIDDSEKLKRRQGFGSALLAGSYHSLWSEGDVALLVSGSTLKQLLPDYTTRDLRSDLSSGYRMWYARIADRVFYSNTVETGVFQAGASRSWGLARPSGQPPASLTGGSLLAGRYQYALTYVRDDLQESGTGRAGYIDLPAVGGIAFSNIPVSPDPSVAYKKIYISPVNGDAMWEQIVLRNADTSAVYAKYVRGSQPLQTQFLSPPPAGAYVASFAGRILMAVGDRLLYSPAFSPELFDLRVGPRFSSRITLVAPVTDGVYLGTETEIVWLGGRDPEKWSYDRRAAYGAIPGTLDYWNAEDTADGRGTGDVAFFATKKGIVAGSAGGTLVNLTKDRFNYPVMDQGAGVVRESRGTIQYIATLQGTEVAGNTAF